MRILPKGLSEQDFEDALQEFSAVIGKQWVFRNENDIELYRDPYSPYYGEDEDPVPSAALAPESTEQVQSIVRIANKYRIPLWTVSTGKNLGYGGAAPLETGTVVLDLKRMNRIIEVNEKYAYALVEPGVSYFDLYNYIQEKGYKLWLDVASPGWGSVLGNALEHGVGYTPYADHFNMQCGMEVVLPDGELLRTGMGAMSGSDTWQHFKYGFGPHIDGLFSQSNLGVVTKMGIWLMPEPPAYRSCYVNLPNPEDIVTMIDKTRPLRFDGTINNGFNIFPGVVDLLFEPDAHKHFLNPQKMPSPPEVAGLLKKHNLGFWCNRIAFYGSEKMVDDQWERVMDTFSSVPGVSYQNKKFIAPYDHKKFDFRDKLQAGVPSMEEWTPMSKSAGHVFFSPVTPFDGQEVLSQIQMVNEIYKDYGMSYMGGPYISTSPRTLVATIGMFVSKTDKKHNEKMREAMTRVIAEGARRGWGEYRTPLYFMEQVMGTYDFNNHALKRFHVSLKDTLDPNGILSPGKNGIWPSSRNKG